MRLKDVILEYRVTQAPTQPVDNRLGGKQGAPSAKRSDPKEIKPFNLDNVSNAFKKVLDTLKQLQQDAVKKGDGKLVHDVQKQINAVTDKAKEQNKIGTSGSGGDEIAAAMKKAKELKKKADLDNRKQDAIHAEIGGKDAVKLGAKGPTVEKIQTKLTSIGYPLGKVDGIWGGNTSRAVWAFKKDNKIKTSPDELSTAEQKTLSKAKKISNPTSTQPPSTNALREPGFMKELNNVARNLGVDAQDLKKIMDHESKMNPSAVNPSGASGLIQFMPDTAKGIGTTVDDIRMMSGTEQLPLVQKYYKKWGVKKGSTLGDLYMITFMPAVVKQNKPDNFVLGDKNSNKKVWDVNQKALYDQNKVFDIKKRGFFTVGDVKDRINTYGIA